MAQFNPTESTPIPPAAVQVRSWAELRALLYFAAPLVASMLVTYGWLRDDTAQLWVALVLNVSGPLLSAILTRSGLRTAIYATVAAVNALLVAYGLIEGGQFEVWLPIVNAVLGGGAGFLAVRNTQRSYALAG